MRFLFFGALLFIVGAALLLIGQLGVNSYTNQQSQVASGALVATYGTVVASGAGEPDQTISFVTANGQLIQARPAATCGTPPGPAPVAIAYNPRNPYYIEERCSSTNQDWLNGAGAAFIGTGTLVLLIELFSHLPIFRTRRRES